MQVSVNQKTHVLSAEINISELLTFLDIQPQNIAVAINFEIIPQALWNQTILVENDQIDIITATQGG